MVIILYIWNLNKQLKNEKELFTMNIKSTEHIGIQRKIVAAMTTDSWQNIPHVCYMYEPDVTAFYKEF